MLVTLKNALDEVSAVSEYLEAINTLMHNVALEIYDHPAAREEQRKQLEALAEVQDCHIKHLLSVIETHRAVAVPAGGAR